MNSLAYASVSLVASVAPVFADSTDRIVIAAMRLSEAPNYSWFSIVEDDSSPHELEGRTTAGVTWVRMPMVPSLGRRLGRETDTELEALFSGKTGGVVRFGNDWKSPAELPLRRSREGMSRPRSVVRGSANAGSFGVAGGQSPAVVSPRLTDRRDALQFRMLQFGVTHPHEELEIIVSSFATMEVAGDVVTGTLSPLGAALLLVRAEQIDIEPLAAEGQFKLWLNNGALIKYQLKLEGVVAFEGGTKMNVHVRSHTTLKDIGTTEVSVPDAAREKLRLVRTSTP